MDDSSQILTFYVNENTCVLLVIVNISRRYQELIWLGEPRRRGANWSKIPYRGQGGCSDSTLKFY